MAYVEAHAGLRDHLKTKKVARLLGVHKVQVIGHMLCLWWWCQEYAQDGDLSSFDAADIAEAAEYEGDPQTFVDALLNCGVKGGAGFLRQDNDTGALLINDWYQYGGKLFVQRAQSAERMRNMRARSANKTDSDVNVTRNDSVTVTHVTPIDKNRIDKSIEEPKEAAVAVPTAPVPSLAERFHTLLAELKETKNKQAKLREIYVLCFGDSDAPEFSRLGQVATKVGGAGRLAELFWQYSAKPPTGDVLAYIQKAHTQKETSGTNGTDNGYVSPRTKMKDLTYG